MPGSDLTISVGIGAGGVSDARLSLADTTTVNIQPRRKEWRELVSPSQDTAAQQLVAANANRHEVIVKAVVPMFIERPGAGTPLKRLDAGEVAVIECSNELNVRWDTTGPATDPDAVSELSETVFV